MFRRKKKEVEIKKQVSYKDWKEDLGFFKLISEKKVKRYSEIIANISGKMTSTLKVEDKDIQPLVSQATKDIMDSMGDNYKEFLIDKYFGTEESIINFVVEDVFDSFVEIAVANNTTRAIEKLREIKRTEVKENKETNDKK